MISHPDADVERPVKVWLREIDPGTDNACWVVCAKGDPGAVEFMPVETIS